MMLKIITEAQKEQFDSDGYLIVKGLFSSEEIEQLKNRFMQIHS
jgi:phytanoyl-CoA hydroxylase